MLFLKTKKLSNPMGYIKAISGEETDNSFWNHTFDKGRLKGFVLWFLKKYGEHKTIHLVEELKNVGFQYATQAGISLGIEDLNIPEKKYSLIMEAEQLSLSTIKQYKRGEITGVERFQRLIDTWHRTSERLKQEVIDNFEATDVLNPVYMMAFSGARGNISQVRQLVGMRGLMSDPQGRIIDFPIRSNFREGLTLTEYIISSYGARKGIVDTALRTANAGYLTRRLVDVAQHVIISSFDCGTKRGIFLTDMKEGNKIIYSLQNRLVGRVLARDIYNDNQVKIGSRNVEISLDLANDLASAHSKIFVRSSLTCGTKKLVCQLCYGWSLAQGNLVSIGEAVGVVAAQSIGEPGTQLTMRTFHTGGVFSGDVSDQIRAPFNGVIEYYNPIAGTLIRTPEGKIAFLTKNEGSFMVHKAINGQMVEPRETKRFKIPFYTLLFLKNGSFTNEKEVIAQISSINRQKNATDQVELTIKSELSGQFYSKFLDLKETKVGPKLKDTDKNSSSISEQFNENAVDIVFEAWGWGYAWVLSGKIYQLGLPSTIFPLLGDYVNKKTFMNQINWNLPSSFGSLFNLNLPEKNKLFNSSSIKEMRNSLKKKLENPPLLDAKEVILLKSQLISFELYKIVYKDIGYFLKLSLPTSSFNRNSNTIDNSFRLGSNFQSSIFSTNDTLFLFSGLFSDKLNNFQKTGRLAPNPEKQKSTFKTNSDVSVYPADWTPPFDVFINWFPKRFATKTGGLIIIDSGIFSQEFHSNKLNQVKKPINLKNTNFTKNRTVRSLAYVSKNDSPFIKTFHEYLTPDLQRKDEIKNLTFTSSDAFKSQNGIHLSEPSFAFLFNAKDNLKSKESFSCDYNSGFSSKKSTVPFFPSFMRRELALNSKSGEKPKVFNKISSLQNLNLYKEKSLLQTNVEFSKNIKDLNKFGNTNFKTISDLSQSLISEYYSQNQFGTMIYNDPSFSKTKSKSNISFFGFMWKNAFKINFNRHSFLRLKNMKSTLQSNSDINFNQKILQNFGKVFWVPQIFYNFDFQKTKLIQFNNEAILHNNFEKGSTISNSFFHLNKIKMNKRPILCQINRQGEFSPLYSDDSFIQSYQKSMLDPILLKNPKTAKILNSFNLAELYQKSDNIDCNHYRLFNKPFAYRFISFNFKTESHLKIRRKSLSKEFLNLSQKQKILTLKSFSKISSIPYFLSPKATMSFKKYLYSKKTKNRNKINPKDLICYENSKNKLSLFHFYFYSLFNKYSSSTFILKDVSWENKNFDNEITSRKDLIGNKFKQIIPLYLKDQMIFGLAKKKSENFNHQKITKKSNYFLLPNKFNKENLYKLNLNYNKRFNFCSYLFNNPNKYLNVEKYSYLLFNKTHFQHMVNERFNYLDQWFKKSNIIKINNLKNLFKLKTKLYRKFLKDHPISQGKKPAFLNQNRKIQYLTIKRSIEPKPAINRSHKKKVDLNLTIKPGWIFYPENVHEFLLYNKKLINAGKILAKDLSFGFYSVYIEIISFDKIKSSNISSNNFGDQTNIQTFKMCVNNKFCRFKMQKKVDPSDFYFILIRKSKEYKFINNLDQKKQFYSLSNQTTIGPTLYNLTNDILSPKLKNKNLSMITKSNHSASSNSRKSDQKVLNKPFNSFNTLKQYNTGLLNKQKITSQTISKYPAADVQLIPNKSFYSAFSEFNSREKTKEKVHGPQESENPVFKFNQLNSYGFNFNQLNSINPTNLGSFIISYNSPYSFNFPFKTPLHIFNRQSDKSYFKNTPKNLGDDFKKILYNYNSKLTNIYSKSNPQQRFKNISSFSSSTFNANLLSIFSSPIAEYSLGNQFEKSISIPNLLFNSNNNSLRNVIWNLNNVKNKRLLKGKNGMVLGSINGSFDFSDQSFKNSEVSLYKTNFTSFMDSTITPQISFLKTSMFCSFEGELIYKSLKPQDLELKPSSSLNQNFDQISSNSIFDHKSIDHECMILTKADQICFYFSTENYKEAYFSLENLKKQNQYMINNIVINFLNVSEENSSINSFRGNQDQSNSRFGNNRVKTNLNQIQSKNNQRTQAVQINKLNAGFAQQKSKLLLGEFLVYGDQISPNVAISKPGQIIHLNQRKVTLRQGQPIFVSPNAFLHKYDGDFIDPQSSVITLTYQQLKTGDIIQGIPKVEQFFEARTTKRGRLFRDSLTNLLKGLFRRYRSKLPFDQAVRQSFYKIQQIIVDGVQRVYRSQGVTIADKHLEIIVKQMTSKVRILEGGQTGFFPGEIVDLDFVEHINSLLMKKIIYEPIILGITKSSLEVDSFLSAASFQQTTRVLSKAAISRKKDFLKGLKENVILGNLIPAGTGYLVYLDPL